MLRSGFTPFEQIYVHLLLRKKNWKFFYEFFCKSWKRISSFFFFVELENFEKEEKGEIVGRFECKFVLKN